MFKKNCVGGYTDSANPLRGGGYADFTGENRKVSNPAVMFPNRNLNVFKVKIKLPDTKVADVKLDVKTKFLDCRSPK